MDNHVLLCVWSGPVSNGMVLTLWFQLKQISTLQHTACKGMFDGDAPIPFSSSNLNPTVSTILMMMLTTLLLIIGIIIRKVIIAFQIVLIVMGYGDICPRPDKWLPQYWHPVLRPFPVSAPLAWKVPWSRPQPTLWGWAGAVSLKISVVVHWCPCGWAGANPCSQASKYMESPSSREEATNSSSVFTVMGWQVQQLQCNVWVYAYFVCVLT